MAWTITHRFNHTFGKFWSRDYRNHCDQCKEPLKFGDKFQRVLADRPDKVAQLEATLHRGCLSAFEARLPEIA